MPQVRPDAFVQVHAPQWNEREFAWLKPVKRFELSITAQNKALQLPPGTDPSKLTPDLLQQFTRDELVSRYTILEMIDHWSLEYAPSEEQAAAGQPGDPVPLCEASVAALSEEDGLFFINEIGKLGGATLEQAKGAPTGAEFPVPGAPAV